MSELSYPYREDRSCSGFFEFTNTGVQYADTGIVGLKHYASFDQGPWAKTETDGTSSYALDVDSGNHRVSDSITSLTIGASYSRTSLWRRLRIPRDFGSWSSLTLFTRKNTASIVSFTTTIWKNATEDAGITDFSILPAVADVWEQFTLTPSGMTYNPGDFVTFELEFTTTAVSAEVFVADWSLLYVTDKVNI